MVALTISLLAHWIEAVAVLGGVLPFFQAVTITVVRAAEALRPP
jgi:hypothetical protein